MSNGPLSNWQPSILSDIIIPPGGPLLHLITQAVSPPWPISSQRAARLAEGACRHNQQCCWRFAYGILDRCQHSRSRDARGFDQLAPQRLYPALGTGPSQQKRPCPHRHPYEPSYLFSAGIRPLGSPDIAGVIWYQENPTLITPTCMPRCSPCLLTAGAGNSAVRISRSVSFSSAA